MKLVSSLLLAFLVAVPVFGQQSAQAEVQATYERYRKAAEAEDLAGIQAAFAPDANTRIFFSNETSRVGMAAIVDGYRQWFAECDQIRLSPKNVAVQVSSAGEVAWMTYLEDGSVTIKGRTETWKDIRATIVFSRISGRWLIAHAHWSTVPLAPPVVEGKVSVDGIEIPYLIEGTGIPCLVINNRLAMRRALSADLRKTFRFIFAEMRVTVPYRQTYALENVNLDTFLDDIERIRAATGFEKVCVFGHSIGGLIAYEYARKYPQHVTHVIMNGTPSAWNERQRALTREFWTNQASAERKEIQQQNVARLKDSIVREPVGRQDIATYLMNTPRYFFDPRYDASWLFEGEHWSPELTKHIFGAVMSGYDIATRPPPPVPIFLALGRHDYAVPYACWDEFKSKTPSLTYHLFDRSGHYPPLEEPELFNARLTEWIQRR